MGDPRDSGTQMGALISQQHMNKVLSFVRIAQKEGATIKCGETVDELNLPSGNKKVL